jgi:hypothetical protein
MASRGYPLQAYTVLRNVFDLLLNVSAAVQGIADFYSLDGVVPGTPVVLRDARILRKKTERSVHQAMMGSASGLSEANREELTKWNDLFDYETHGGRLSLTQAVRWMRQEAPLPILPEFEQRSFAMFVNRYSEIAWMLHRLMPLLQPPEVLFTSDWLSKRNLLDDSFKIMVEALTVDLGKPIGAAIVELVSTKFPFNARSTFPL